MTAAKGAMALELSCQALELKACAVCWAGVLVHMMIASQSGALGRLDLTKMTMLLSAA